MASGHEQDNGHHSSGSPYIIVWLALLALTGISYLISLYHLGELGFLVAMVVATTKATMVALIFMHLKGERFTPKFTLIIAIGFILLMAGLMIGDVETRYTFPKNSLPHDYVSPGEHSQSHDANAPQAPAQH